MAITSIETTAPHPCLQDCGFVLIFHGEGATAFIITGGWPALLKRYRMEVLGEDVLTRDADVAAWQAYLDDFANLDDCWTNDEDGKPLSFHQENGEISSSTVYRLYGFVQPATLHPDLSASTIDVIAERTRQIVELKRDAYHDDTTSDDGELASAAAAYALNAACQLHPQMQAPLTEAGQPPAMWPAAWSESDWKPKDPRRDLVRAGALVLAEIDRIDRAT